MMRTTVNSTGTIISAPPPAPAPRTGTRAGTSRFRAQQKPQINNEKPVLKLVPHRAVPSTGLGGYRQWYQSNVAAYIVKMAVKMLVTIVIGFGTISMGAIPSYIHVCSRNDPAIDRCIVDSVERLRAKLKTGIPDLHVPPIEPLLLDEIRLRSGPNQAKIDANITNARVWGPSGFEIIDLKSNLKRNRFVFRVNVPHIYFQGDYDIDMSVLILKYKGQGPITGNFTDYKFDCVMKGDLVTNNGQRHLRFRQFGLTLYIGRSHLHLGNLFVGQNPTLSRATNDVVRDNSDLFVNEIKPVLEDSLAQKFTAIANSITERFTYDELFAD